MESDLVPAVLAQFLVKNALVPAVISQVLVESDLVPGPMPGSSGE